MPGTGGSNAREMLSNPHKGYLLMGVEPGLISGIRPSMETLGQAEFVVALSAFRSKAWSRWRM